MAAKAVKKKAVAKKAVKKVSRNRTPDFPEWPTWSTARAFGFFRSGIRASWQRWPPKYTVLAAASRPYTGHDKRQKKEFQCNCCKEWWKQSQVSVDHIIPAGSLRSFEDLPGFYSRLFVGPDKLQVLCDTCHKEKTAADKLLHGETLNEEE